jgi:hypothetical protein
MQKWTAMRGIKRRAFFKGMLAAGAAGAASGLLPGAFRRHLQAQTMLGVYPTIFIHLPGGLDHAMHWDAKPGYVNRNVQAADVRTTAAGVMWYEPTLAPITNHMEDCCLIRNVTVSSSHIGGAGLLWYGEQREEDAAVAMPWANYMASQLVSAVKVPAPNLVTFRDDPDDAIPNYTTFNNQSPNPLGAAQRVQAIADFTNGLDVLNGQPDPLFKQRVFQTVGAFDMRLYSNTVQATTAANFTAANSLATELLTQPIPPVWPPEANVQTLFDMDNNDLNNIVGSGNQRFVGHLALAYQVARLQLSHVVFIKGTQGGYDTHNNHDAGQRNRSNTYFPEIERLLSALKATPSPLDNALTMFDTTNVVIASELSRANRVDNGEDNDGLGTPHWPWIQVAMFGGAFKRGYAFGDLDANFEGVPADFDTGALNQGVNPTMKNVIATILKANGVDPAGWSSEAPINAILQGG